MPTSISAQAPAKINLTLEVLRKRPDDYHEVSTILQTIDLWDHLTFTESDETALECNVRGLEGPDNLALKAAQLLAGRVGVKRGVLIRLQKGIPVSAGLGGGSTDAAATLLALDTLWELHLSRKTLSDLAAKLGSDVPFFLTGGTALAAGRGEQLKSLPALPQTWLVLHTLDIPLPNKTATMYNALAAHDYTDGSATEDAVEYVERGRRIPADQMVNTFEKVAYRMFRGLDRDGNEMRNAGLEAVHIAGAGPTLFSVVSDRAQGDKAVQALRAKGLQAWCVCTVQQAVTLQSER